MKNKRFIKYTKERPLLSDVLPYELPLIFFNSFFYDFVVKNKIVIKTKVQNGRKHKEIHWISNNKTIDNLVKILFGEPNVKINYYNGLKSVTLSKMHSSPFSFRTVHKDIDYRELSVPHPIQQLEVARFYHDYKESILYYCSLSNFSIRYPSNIARFAYFKDSFYIRNKLIGEISQIEESRSQINTFKSFFAYQKYSNIYKFYESHEYLRCEKKFSKLRKLDISKCFDSIYTHTICWAIFGKDIAKDNLFNSTNKSVINTFSRSFDELMQNTNYKETNGIIIGPEFSRIFAEIILQSIDFTVEKKLLKSNLKNKIDYQIFRYVDDYFIFYNEDKVKEEILGILIQELKIFKLSINPKKIEEYERPIITQLTIAKRKISDLFESEIKLTVEDAKDNSIKKYNIFINSKKLKILFKTIIKESGLTYLQLMNFTLMLVLKYTNEIIMELSKENSERPSIKNIVNAFNEFVDYVFFIYSVSPTVNHSVKLCQFIMLIKKFIENYHDGDSNISYDEKHSFLKAVYNNVLIIFNKKDRNKYAMFDTIYLLVILAELGIEYMLNETVLKKLYTEFDKKNYITFILFLYYIGKDINNYKSLLQQIEDDIIDKITKNKNSLFIETELSLLSIDSLSCPYISVFTKKKILNEYGITKKKEQRTLFHQKRVYFTDWHTFNLVEALDKKIGLEVY